MTKPTSNLSQHSDFKKLWAAQAVSAFGSTVTRTLLPILAIMTIGAGPMEVSILSALSVAPGVLVGLLMGGRVDRSKKRPLLIGSDLIRALMLATVPVAAWLDLLTMMQLYVVAAIVGAATTLFRITDNAYLPALIGKPDLVEANSKLEVTDAVAEVGAPTLAGILIEIVSAPMAILFDTISYLVSAVFLGLIDKKEDTPEPEIERPTLKRDIVIGMKAMLEHPLVRPLFFVFIVGNFFNGFFAALYMIFALETLNVPPGILGVLIGLGGIGAILGAFIARWLPARIGLGPAMILLLGLGQGSLVLIPLANGPDWVIIACLGVQQFLGDALMVAYFILQTSLRQTVLPQNVLGRANATIPIAVGATLPFSILFAGWLAATTDVRSIVWIGAIGGNALVFILFFSQIRTLKEMPKVEEE